MDCINLLCKMLDDFAHKLNSPNQHLHTNSPALIFFPAEKRYLFQITSMFSFLYIFMTSLFTLVFILSCFSSGNCIAIALATGNPSAKAELTGMNSGYKVNKGAA